MKHFFIACFLSFAAFPSGRLHAAVPLQPIAGSSTIDADRVGIVAAVKGVVDISHPTRVGRVVDSGAPIFLGDLISTDDEGQLQIMLLDETIFTIGKNSKMIIDEFVYDPKTHEGEVHATIVKGVFRFITGNIARKKPENMEVTLPVGSLGIRGTMVGGKATGNSAYVALLAHGRQPGDSPKKGEDRGFVLNNQVGNEVKGTSVMRVGFGSEIQGPNLPPTGVFRVPDNIMKELTDPFTDPKGGGADTNGDSRDDATNGQDGDAKSGATSGPGGPGGTGRPNGAVSNQASGSLGNMPSNFGDAGGFQGNKGRGFGDFKEREDLGGDLSFLPDNLSELGGEGDLGAPPGTNEPAVTANTSFEDLRGVSDNNKFHFEDFGAATTEAGITYNIEVDIDFGFGGGGDKFGGNSNPDSEVTQNNTDIGDFTFALDNDCAACDFGDVNNTGEAIFTFSGITNSETGACTNCVADIEIRLKNIDENSSLSVFDTKIATKFSHSVTIYATSAKNTVKATTSPNPTLVDDRESGVADGSEN
jgi:hypothetical protein